MVGIFSRFSVRSAHRRTQSALDRREELPTASDVTAGRSTLLSSASATAHGLQIALEFKPVERPIEPSDGDQPIQCPLPEPSILNDGRIWKERVSSGLQRGADMPAVVQDQAPETPSRKPRPNNRGILPSVSAPEHNLLKLLDECNASGI